MTATQIPEPTGQPTAPRPIRETVNRFLNEQEAAGFKALTFRMDYTTDGEYDGGELSLVEFHHYLVAEEMNEGNWRAFLREGDIEHRLVLQHSTLLRISEERMLPIGVWFWDYTTDVLSYLGD